MHMKILVVDDEADVQPLFVQRFRKEIKSGEFDFSFALSGEEALAYLEKHHSEVILILSDINMPGMTGIQLAEIVRLKRPHMPVLLATGYTDLPASKLANLPRLAKPYQQAQLQAEIEKLLDIA